MRYALTLSLCIHTAVYAAVYSFYGQDFGGGDAKGSVKKCAMIPVMVVFEGVGDDVVVPLTSSSSRGAKKRRDPGEKARSESDACASHLESTPNKKISNDEMKEASHSPHTVNSNAFEHRPFTPSLHNHPPHYPKEARERGLEGAGIFRLSLFPTGKVDTVIFLKGELDQCLLRAAMETLKRWTFTGDIPPFVEVPVEFTLI